MEPILNTYIELRGNRDGQPRAYISGTRVRVQDVYAQVEVHGKTPEQIVASLPHLSLAQIHAALAFYFDNRELILNEIRQDGEFASLMKSQLGPGPLELKLQDTKADDALPLG